MDDHPATQRIYALIGMIATSWSEVELFWYLIFTGLLPNTQRAQANAIYFQWDTNARQRELIQALALAAYPPDKKGHPHPLQRRVGRLHAKTNDAAGRRNDAVHGLLNIPISGASLYYGDDDFKILRSHNPRKPNKLAGKKNLRDELTETVKIITSLRQELKAYLEETSPKFEVSPDMLAALRKLGFQVQPLIARRPAGQVDPEASS